MDDEVKSFRDLVDILRRRWKTILGATLLLLGIGIITAGVWPRKYRSTATILIEAQEVPTEYVKANITSFADQRLQTINQRIMGTPRLLEIIRRFNLYSDLKSRMTMDEIIDTMRKKDIKFNTISADVVDPRSGRPGQATIAFSVSFQASKPDIAQQVASELSSLYMAENLKVREQQSQVTSQFLSEELKNVQSALSAIEGRIAAYKQRNLNSLPELAQVNMQAFEQVDRDIRQISDQYRTLKEKEESLQSQLAYVSPELETNEKESLRQLRLRLTDLKSRFSDAYPDVIKTRTELQELERQMRDANQVENGKPDNPAYISLASQLAGTRSDIEMLKRQIAELSRKKSAYQSRIMSSPRVEEGYKAMMIERNNLQQKYDDLSRKTMEANVAHGLEKEQLGERFTLVDPARLPEKPASPNVPAIILVGLLGGIFLGVGITAIKESCDRTVRKPEDLARVTGIPVLVTVPEIACAADRGQGISRRMALVAACAVVAVCAVLFCHYYIMDLDVFGAKLSRLLARYR